MESFGLSILLEEKLIPKQKILEEKEKTLAELQNDKALPIEQEFYIKYREKVYTKMKWGFLFEKVGMNI